MGSLHLITAWIAAAAAVALLVAAGATATGRTVGYRALDSAILAQLAATVVAAAVGLLLPLTGATVGDPLHLLYAVVAIGAAPAARYAGRGEARRIGRFAVVAGLVALGSVLRLFMTGS